MTILRRLSSLISANLHALLDRAEDPEQLLAQLIREMEEGLADARRHTARTIACERRLDREHAGHVQAVEHWKEKARSALRMEREDLARRALIRKREHHDVAQALNTQLQEANVASDRLRTSLRALEARLSEARRKERTLVARHRAATARAELQQALGVCHSNGTAGRFHELEARLESYDDELTAQAELAEPGVALEEDFADLTAARDIEEELAALKREKV